MKKLKRGDIFKVKNTSIGEYVKAYCYYEFRQLYPGINNYGIFRKIYVDEGKDKDIDDWYLNNKWKRRRNGKGGTVHLPLDATFFHHFIPVNNIITILTDE